jgi:hypothetical protein
MQMLIDTLEGLAAGRLSSNIMSPRELLDLLSRAQATLPKGMDFAVGTGSAELYQYYQLAQVRAMTIGTNLKIFIDLPLSMMGHHYHLFQIQAVPIADAEGKVVTLYHPGVDHFLISIDRASYVIPPSGFLGRCRRAVTWVCPADFPIYRREHPSCVNALFHGEEDNIRLLCPHTALLTPPDDVWVWDAYKQTWIFSLSKKKNVLSQCHTKDGVHVEERSLQGIGELQAARGCQITTPDYQILANSFHVGQEEFQKRLVAIHVPPQAILDIPSNPRVSSPIGLLTQLRHEGHAWPGKLGLEVDVAELQRANEELLLPSPPATADQGWTTYLLLCLLLSGLLAVAVAWWRCMRCRKRLRRNHVQADVVTLSTIISEAPSTAEGRQTCPQQRRIYKLTPKEVAKLESSLEGDLQV